MRITADQHAANEDRIRATIDRLAKSDATIGELTDFRGQALARLAAQHDEIARLRQEARPAAGIRRLPVAAPSGKEQHLP